MECNAPKIVAALVYLATFGRVTIPVDAVRMILRKGTASRVSQIVASLFADWPCVHCFISNAGDCSDRLPLPVDQAIVQYTPNKWTDTFLAHRKA